MVFCAKTVPPQPPVIVYFMIVVPAATALITPVLALIVATLVLLLLQAPVPPDKFTAVAVYVAVAPTQSASIPVTALTLAIAAMFTEIGTRGDTHELDVKVTIATPFPVLPVIFKPPAGLGMEASPAIILVLDKK